MPGEKMVSRISVHLAQHIVSNRLGDTHQLWKIIISSMFVFFVITMSENILYKPTPAYFSAFQLC